MNPLPSGSKMTNPTTKNDRHDDVMAFSSPSGSKKADFIDLFNVHPGEFLDFNIKLNFIKQTLSTLFLSIYYARANKEFFQLNLLH